MLIQLKKHFFQPLIIIASIAFFLSCQKDVKNNTTQPPLGQAPDLSTKISSSVSGFVTDEGNLPVLGASVNFGANSTTTDKYGHFEIRNTDVVKTAAVVTVTKTGYFKGIRTYSATANKAAFFRIKLIPKTLAGTINASSGGNISLSNGLIVAIPSNGVVIASNNTAYTGTINVAAYWIDPQAPELSEIMPGDLRGIDNAGLLQGLTTYGMAAVELTSASGELLQIATGKKATITMPLSSLLASAAPSSIPLWYFDETSGLWKQDGSATKTGNTYVGDVSHFSYWNCDLPNAIVPLTFTVVDASGNPIGDAYVNILPLTPNSWSHCGGYTDSSGFVSVFVTPNATYSLNIFSSCSYYGGSASYTQTFSVGTDAVSLGNIVISTGTTATVSGSITNCSGSPMTNGYIVVQNGYYYTTYPVDNTGSYSFSTVLCSSTMTVNLIAEDITASQQSTAAPYTLVSGINAIGNIQACGVTTAEFINYTVNGGSNISITPPGDSLVEYTNGASSIFISGSGNSGTTNSSIYFGFDSTGIAAGTTQNLLNFYSSSIANQTSISTPILVNITEYGAVGNYISGNFTGTVTGPAPGNTPYLITCNFRVRRSY